MIKRIIIIPILLLITLNGISQFIYFNNTYANNNLGIAALSIEKDGNNYITVSITDNASGNRSLIFHKFDSLGNIIYQKPFEVEYHHVFPGHPGNMHKVWDGGYIISGALVDTNGYNKAFLLKIDKDFNFEFIKEFEDTGSFHHAEFQQCKITKDKCFILAGNQHGFGYYDDDILLIKTDSLGIEQWRRVINLGAIDNARSITETPDKGYLLGGYSWDYYNAWASGNGRIIKLDSAGNFEWGRQFGNPIYNDAQALVALAPDSNYIVATAYSDITYPMNGSRLKIQVVKIDKYDGSTIWSKQYDTIRDECNPKMVKVLADGNIVVIGNEGYWDGINYYFTSWILKLKPNGDSLYFRRYYKNNNQYTLTNTSWDFCIAEDKSIVSCGYVSMQNDYQKLWLAKMDSLGCLQPGCDPTAGIEEPLYLKPGQLQIFPNPTTTQTTITYPTAEKAITLQIYNMLGQMVYEEKLSKGSSQTIINTSGFNSGLYKVVAGESSGSLIIN